jgi:hypothetical protein
MSTLPARITVEPAFELRFPALGAACAAIAVPCDEAGTVDLDDLDDAERARYLYAHTLIGRDFAPPVVRCVDVKIA